MANIVVVDSNNMRETRVITARGAALGDKVHVVEAVPAEFRSLMAYYPILLSKDASVDRYMWVVVLGLQDGENLYLDGDTWNVPYVPVNIRRQPFNVAAAPGKDPDGNDVQVPALSIDLDHPRVSPDGEALFDEEGKPSEYLDTMNKMMGGIFESTRRGRELAQWLQDEELIRPLNIGYTVATTGEKHSVGGLYGVNEDKLRELTDEKVLDLHKRGLLAALYTAIASLGQLGSLMERKNARLKAGGDAPVQAGELELPE